MLKTSYQKIKKLKFSFKGFMKMIPQARLLIQNQGAGALYLIVGFLILFILVTSIMYGKNHNVPIVTQAIKGTSSINKIATSKINIFKKSRIRLKKLTKLSKIIKQV